MMPSAFARAEEKNEGFAQKKSTPALKRPLKTKGPPGENA